MHPQYTPGETTYKEIPLSGKHGAGKVVLVDAADYEWLNQWKWYCTHDPRKTDYARGTVNGKHTLMHRLITGAPPGVPVDHKDGNGLNNRRGNLRRATTGKNKQNAKKRSHDLSSRYKGVSREPRHGYKWIAQIRVDGKLFVLGRFDSEEQAAEAYNCAALKYFGEFAHVNKIP